jgi:signal transduction histidine kinase
VQGATNRSPWGEPGAALRITIEAPWWSRWEFRALLAAVALALAAGIYRYRVQTITRALEIRFDERTRERTRIARDLHDSLLQGFQGLTLKYHALAHTLTPGSSARTSIEANLRQARKLIEDVRTRVQDLRSADEPQAALEDLLREFTDILAKPSATAFEIRVIGEPRLLDPIALEEVLLVGKEAISNAMTHADAARIEVELTYEARELMLRVSDNGIGMDTKTLEAGRPGHWGLQGMRERAVSLGAVLEVWSRQGGGTDIHLFVPGAAAYRRLRTGANAGPIKRFMLAIAAGRWPS